MKKPLTLILVPALLILGSLTAFAGDGSLPYKPVSGPPVIADESAPTVQLENRASMGFRPEIQPPAASMEPLPPVKSAFPSIGEDQGHTHVH